ncbi:MAG TPA: hypothetical protein VEI01_07260 [Terriglobales bacterium]|nr:hypothetical protein [Terriglobales bacterium]
MLVNDPIGQRSRHVSAHACRLRPVGRGRRILLTFAFLVAGLATGALLAAEFDSYFVLPPDPPPLAWDLPSFGNDGTLASVPQTEPQTRPIYPFSIIPGGIRDRWDLERNFDDDPVVAEHYRGFNFRHLRLMLLAEDEWAYVSYRIGQKVFWTSHRVALHRGEKLLTDGNITARTRCGNQVSALPHPAVSPLEPSEAQLDQPLPPMIPATFSPVPPNMPALAQPTVPSHSGWFPPLIPLYPFGGGSPASTPHPKTPIAHGPPPALIPVPQPVSVPVSMPEPGEFAPAALFLSCAGLLGVYRHYRGRWRK